MERSISSTLRTIFLIHMIIALVLGAALWIIPGRTLELLGWIPKDVQVLDTGLSIPGTTYVDNVITRLLGAALLALAFTSYRGWRAVHWEQISIVVQAEFILCAMGTISTLFGLYKLDRPVPLIGWVIAALLAIFSLLWGWSLRR